MYCHISPVVQPPSHPQAVTTPGVCAGQLHRAGTTPADRDLLPTKRPGEIRKSTHTCTCAKSTGQKRFRWHFINAVQPATLNQHKLYREDEQDERPFILPLAENTLRLFLEVSDGAERKHNDSHRADLLLQTSEIMVGPTDLMQCAAVTNNVSVALRKNLLESCE